MKLIHINVWRPCMQCPQGKYIQHIPEYVEKINAGQEFLRAYKYGMTQYPFWVIVDDEDNVVATSVELDIDKVLEWAAAYIGEQSSVAA